MRSVLYTLIVSTTLSVLFVIAPVSYLVVYQWYIPYSNTRLPLDLDYSGRFGSFDMLPVDVVHATTHRAVQYSLAVSLTLPRTEHNIKLGNFMVRTSLVTHDDLAALLANDTSSTLLAHRRKWPITMPTTHELLNETTRTRSATKPAILPKRASVTQLLDDLMLYPLHVTGWRTNRDEETVRRDMFADWTAVSKGQPAGTRLVVELDRTVNVEMAALELDVQWRGVRWLMFHYKVSMFVLGTMFFWAVESLAAMVVALIVVQWFGASSATQDSDHAGSDRHSVGAGDTHKEHEKEGQQARQFRQRVITRRPDIEVHDPNALLQEPTPAPEDDDASSTDTDTEDSVMDRNTRTATTQATTAPATGDKPATE